MKDHINTREKPGTMREEADYIIRSAIAAVMPNRAVEHALESFRPAPGGKVVLIAAGKAAWQMAKAAAASLKGEYSGGVVITKYAHSGGDIERLRIFEAGHPVPDQNSFLATREAIKAVEGLEAQDTVLFLLSGGGSALFEEPLIAPEMLAEVTAKLLACGADIRSVNTIRKRLSAVKGGRFALLCEPASVFLVVLSDILGDPLDMIASGPCSPDSTTCEDAQAVLEEYDLSFPEEVMDCLKRETPKELCNVSTFVTGSVRELCSAAASAAAQLGYEPRVLACNLSCEARKAGRQLAQLALSEQGSAHRPLALIQGGETVVHVTGQGKGGRNQEIALSAALVLDGAEDICVFSVGSDGTDGPTDAAGGYSDGSTAAAIRSAGIDPAACLADNDSYTALDSCGCLIFTGPTGTNVNDVSIALVRPKSE